MSFSDEEVAYLRSHRLARLATVASDGQPDVVPVGVEFDGTHLYVGGLARPGPAGSATCRPATPRWPLSSTTWPR